MLGVQFEEIHMSLRSYKTIHRSMSTGKWEQRWLRMDPSGRGTPLLICTGEHFLSHLKDSSRDAQTLGSLECPEKPVKTQVPRFWSHRSGKGPYNPPFLTSTFGNPDASGAQTTTWERCSAMAHGSPTPRRASDPTFQWSLLLRTPNNQVKIWR